MVDNKTADDKPAEKATVSKSTVKKSTSASSKKAAAKKTSAVSAKKAAPKKESAAAVETNASATKTANFKAATAATAKAAASKESDMKAAAEKISEIDRTAATNGFRSNKGAEDLKSRAHEAKQRAQKKILEKSFVSDKPADPLERLANTFDSSARRWEMVVYPSLFAFVLLAGYGFFLIYRLTHDIAILSQSVTHMAVIVSDAMPRMAKDLGTMTGSVNNMTDNIDGMTDEIVSMSGQMDSLTPMSENLKSMTHNIGNMNRSVYGMQRDMHGMNRTVSSGPFGMMNDMMPFSSNSNVPPPMAPPPTWPAYNNQPQRNVYARHYQPVRAMPVKQAKAIPSKSIKTEVMMPGASPVSLKEVSSPKSSAAVQDKAQ